MTAGRRDRVVPGRESAGMRTLDGRYQLVQRIGIGGMSEVWRGHDRVLDRPVAVKIMAPAVEGTLGAVNGVDLIRTEARSAARLAHPNVAKVHDFGTAAAAGSPDPDPDGPVMGTPAYVAPERFEGLPATPATDMFALGVLLYHCLSGRLPWWAQSNTALVERQRHGDPDPLPHIDGLAPEVIDLCSRCLHKDPRDRPTALVAALVL